jgi:competence protein ComEA
MDDPDGTEGLRTRLRVTRAEAVALGLLVTGVLATVAVAGLLPGPRPGTPSAAAPVAALALPTAAATAPSAAPEVVVHVAGAVGAPGVYRLAAGSRVADALERAGGALPEAQLAALNLARSLADGEQVLVAGPGVPPPAAAPAAGAQRPDGLLDLNRATAADLEDLPGVGPVLAERIVAHRDEIGGFTSVDQLHDVSGIGESTFADLAPLVAV